MSTPFPVKKGQVIEAGEGHSFTAKRDGMAYWEGDTLRMTPAQETPSTHPEKAIREALPVVAWRDDGLSAANGTEDSSYRVVTDKTKQNMPRAAMEAYTEALVLKSDAEAQLAKMRAEAERLKAIITEHNSDCIAQCEARKAAGPSHCPMKGYRRNCSDCPRDGMVDAAISMIVSGEEKSLEEVLDMADAALNALQPSKVGGEGEPS